MFGGPGPVPHGSPVMARQCRRRPRQRLQRRTARRSWQRAAQLTVHRAGLPGTDHLTLDFQIVDSNAVATDWALVPGIRAHIEF
jgi:hypothetical protein